MKVERRFVVVVPHFEEELDSLIDWISCASSMKTQLDMRGFL